jgi:hypothetical protein
VKLFSVPGVFLAGISLLALAGCAHRNTDNLDAVKQGVIRDLSKNINVAAMDVNVISVSFRGQEADAVVSFAPKGGPPAMTMNYTMERKGDDWHIKSRAQSDLQKHAAQAPPGSMQGGSMQGNGMGDLPAGHPPATNGTGSGANLPPGHPPLDSKQ